MNIGNGGVLAARSVSAGPFVTFNLASGDFDVGTPVGAVSTPGNIDLFNHNMVFWNSDAFVTGNLNIGSASIVNVSTNPVGGQHSGNISVFNSALPGVLNFFSDFTVNGNVDCGGVPKDTPTATVNTFGNTISVNGFLNCGP